MPLTYRVSCLVSHIRGEGTPVPGGGCIHYVSRIKSPPNICSGGVPLGVRGLADVVPPVGVDAHVGVRLPDRLKPVD